MNLLSTALAANPTISTQLPVPRVVEADADVIDLERPFTLELPAMISESYTDVLLVFVNADGSFSPQAVVQGRAYSNVPTRGTVNNNQLSPPFTRAHTAVLQCFIRIGQTDIWQRTADSIRYSFRSGDVQN